MHFHTSLTSDCGSVTPEDSLPAFKKAGYSGIVVTDHFREDMLVKYDSSLSWHGKVDVWLRGYRAAKEIGDAIGVTVLLGMELHFANAKDANEYLIYGLSEQQLYDCVELYNWGEERTAVYARENGLFFAQSHPFRPKMTRYDPAKLDGMEVYNGNRRWNSRNDEAAAYAAAIGLRPLSGSDFHEWEDLTGAGVRFGRPIPDGAALVAALKEGDYTLVHPVAVPHEQ